MLSAIVKCLPRIRKEPSADRRQVLVDICVSAYPDLCPWQVKQALLERKEDGATGSTVNGAQKDLSDLYYYYLSNLLHPHDGHDAARHDAGLVEVSEMNLLILVSQIFWWMIVTNFQHFVAL